MDIPTKSSRYDITVVLDKNEHNALATIKSKYNIHKFDYNHHWVDILGPPVEWEQHEWVDGSNAVSAFRNAEQSQRATLRVFEGCRKILGAILDKTPTEVHNVFDLMSEENLREKPKVQAYSSGKYIRFRPEYLATSSDVDVFNTVLHEITHHILSISGFDYLVEYEGGHGPLWIALALELGCSAEMYGVKRGLGVSARDVASFQCPDLDSPCLLQMRPYEYAESSVIYGSFKEIRCGRHNLVYKNMHPMPDFEDDEEQAKDFMLDTMSNFMIFKCMWCMDKDCVRIMNNTFKRIMDDSGVLKGEKCVNDVDSPYVFTPTFICTNKKDPCDWICDMDVYGKDVYAGARYDTKRCEKHGLPFIMTSPIPAPYRGEKDLMDKIHIWLKTLYSVYKCDKYTNDHRCLRVYRNPVDPDGNECELHHDEEFKKVEWG